MPGRHGLDLSITQLIVGAAATITATVAASYFGVGGTLIGAGVVSVLSTVGATVYQHFLDRGKARIAAKIPVRAGGGTDGTGPGDGPPPGAAARARPWPKWYVVLGAAAGVFLAVMGLVTAFELVTGKPLSNTVRGRAGQGTSVHPVVAPVRPLRTPPASHRPTTEATTEATATSSAAPVPEARPTPTPSPSGTLRPVPGERSAEVGAGPPAIRSAVPPTTSDGSPQTP
jgi:hypothetical protein